MTHRSKKDYTYECICNLCDTISRRSKLESISFSVLVHLTISSFFSFYCLSVCLFYFLIAAKKNRFIFFFLLPRIDSRICSLKRLNLIAHRSIKQSHNTNKFNVLINLKLLLLLRARARVSVRVFYSFLLSFSSHFIFFFVFVLLFIAPKKDEKKKRYCR